MIGGEIMMNFLPKAFGIINRFLLIAKVGNYGFVKSSLQPFFPSYIIRDQQQITSNLSGKGVVGHQGQKSFMS